MKLDPLSVPYRAVSTALNVQSVVFLVTVVGSGVDVRSLAFVGLTGAYLLALLVYQALYYRRFEYHLADGSLDIASGVLSRRRREIPLGRIQNVDVSQNPLQRALGIAGVRIETAGGGDTEASLRYLDAGEATGLRRRLRDREGTDRGETPRPPADSEVVFSLSNRNLALLSLFTIDPGAGVVSSLLGALASGGDPSNVAGLGRVLDRLPGGRPEAILFGILAVAAFTWLLSVALTFARYYGFELRRAGGDLEYERGLLQRYSGTIPTEKVQTVSVRENPLKRRFGYASVAVETAGYSPGQSSGGGSQAAVPLAPRDRALSVADSIEPFDSVAVDPPPARARLRYAFRYALTATVLGVVAYGLVRWQGVALGAYWPVLFAPVALAPVAAHYKWVHRGHRAGTETFVARSGFWSRTTRVVPYYRIQTVVDSRSAFQRRRRLASVTADTASSASIVGGDATAYDVDDGDAEDLRELLADRLQSHLRSRRRRRRERRAPTAGGDTGGSQGAADADDPGGTDASGDAGGGDATGATDETGDAGASDDAGASGTDASGGASGGDAAGATDDSDAAGADPTGDAGPPDDP